MCATWEIGGDLVPRVLFVNDFTSSAPAYRWPDKPMPACRTGHIAFGPARYPTLAEVIELLPHTRPRCGNTCAWISPQPRTIAR